MKRVLLLLALIGSISTSTNATGDVIRFSSRGLDLHSVIMTTDSKGRDVFTLSDLTYAGSKPQITDLVLSFNSSFSHLAKDDTGKYHIHNSLYCDVERNGVLGGGGAHFYKVDHRVEILSARELWLGRCDDLGSFTIEFRLFPLSLADGAMLFSRVGYLSSEKNGIEIVLRGGRILVRMLKMFRDSSGRRYSVILNRGKELEKGEWHHFYISFDRISGKLVKCLNGVEEEVQYITKSGDPFIQVFEPSFACEDLPLAIIGENYTGYLDEFRISYRNIIDLEKETAIAYRNYKEVSVINRLPVNSEGSIQSPVYSFPSTGTSVTLFMWNEIIRKNTFIWMEFRISDNLFLMNDKNLKWYRIENNQKNIYLKRVGDEFLRGKYYQWRAHLIPSPDGKYSPSIYNIQLKYSVDTPPKTPIFLEVTRQGDRIVGLKWKKNVEHDIYGYKIFYGLKSGRYDGVIGYVKSNRITNSISKNKNYIEVDVTNMVIEENRHRYDDGIFSYPLLNNSVLYYFAISAYDSYKPDTIYNHESKLSNEVSARPFGGSEISQ
ncbi:MAG: LamG-like jellyroll fold domain-containing protein [Spirochaetota bacterium]|nr:LamG-like jellyroll fold domain-containing protein [Spirochaetota bacterium]